VRPSPIGSGRKKISRLTPLEVVSRAAIRRLGARAAPKPTREKPSASRLHTHKPSTFRCFTVQTFVATDAIFWMTEPLLNRCPPSHAPFS
jgi:hypothetical protein